MHIQIRTHVHTIYMSIYIHTLYTHAYTYNGMDYWCTSVMKTLYIDTLHCRTLRTHIFLSKNAPKSNHNPHGINCSLKKDTFILSYQLPIDFLSYKLLVQRIFQIVWYHLWCRLPEAFAIRYIDEPTYSHSTQFYFLDYRYLYDLLQASKYIYTKFSPAFGLSKYVIFMNGYYLPTIR